MRAALQLHMTAPSSPLSHSASDLHLPELFIAAISRADARTPDALTGRLETDTFTQPGRPHSQRATPS
jgi:hypothetical protein